MPFLIQSPILSFWFISPLVEADRHLKRNTDCRSYWMEQDKKESLVSNRRMSHNIRLREPLYFHRQIHKSINKELLFGVVRCRKLPLRRKIFIALMAMWITLWRCLLFHSVGSPVMSENGDICWGFEVGTVSYLRFFFSKKWWQF